MTKFMWQQTRARSYIGIALLLIPLFFVLLIIKLSEVLDYAKESFSRNETDYNRH